jgi:hypothetical protein
MYRYVRYLVHSLAKACQVVSRAVSMYPHPCASWHLEYSRRETEPAGLVLVDYSGTGMYIGIEI